MSSSSNDSGFNLLAILFVIYQIGVPITGLYFLYKHATHDVHGFGSFLWYLVVSSIEGFIWPIALFWV